jgi:hypothetical protein
MAPTSAKIHDKAGEALEIGRVVCQCRKLATHLRPDLDATLAIWMCQRIRKNVNLQTVEVIFIPSSTTSVDNGIFAVDLGLGRGVQRFGHGRSLKRSSIKGSAAMAVSKALPEADRIVLDPLVQAISDANEKGDNIHVLTLQDSTFPDGTKRWDHSPLRHQIVNTTMWAIFDDLLYVADDQEVLRIWSLVFDGILAEGLKKREALQASDNAELRFNGVMAILPHNAPQQTSKAVYGRGAKIAVFSSYLGGDRWTLGVSRKSGDDARFIDFHDNQHILKKYVPDLFIHPGGFMAGWTIKSPLVCSADDFKFKREALIVGVSELVRNAVQSKG